jgi:tRNA-uridine 2-sulfurtransferase
LSLIRQVETRRKPNLPKSKNNLRDRGMSNLPKNKSEQKVFVMLSGGVDSSVAACQLVQEGYEVVGVFMKCWSLEMLKSMGLSEELYGCFWEDDARDAELIAKKLGIPFEIWDFQQEYKNKVIDYMIAEYAKGRTPNPDVMCNGFIKFGIFYRHAMERGADFVASGHYARIEKVEN